jgi:hypothetical protein
MFASQKRKFVVPGLKRTAADVEEAAKPTAGSSNLSIPSHHPSGALEQDSNSQVLKKLPSPADKENIGPNNGAAAVSSTQHLATVQAKGFHPAKKPFLPPKPGLTGSFKLPSVQKPPLAVLASSTQAVEEAAYENAQIFSVLYTKRDKYKVKDQLLFIDLLITASGTHYQPRLFHLTEEVSKELPRWCG